MKRFANARSYGAAAVAVVAVAFVQLVVFEGATPASNADPIAPHSASAPPARTAAPDRLDLSRLSREGTGTREEHLFSVRGAPAPGPSAESVVRRVSAPETAIARRAPPLPFRFLGRMTDGAVTTAYLVYRGEHLMAKAGEDIDGLYRLEKIDDANLVFIFLPLAESQTLPTGVLP